MAVPLALTAPASCRLAVANGETSGSAAHPAVRSRVRMKTGHLPPRRPATIDPPLALCMRAFLPWPAPGVTTAFRVDFSAECGDGLQRKSARAGEAGESGGDRRGGAPARRSR